MYSLKTCAIRISMSKNLHVWSIKPFWESPPGKNRVYFFHNISYLEAIFFPEKYTVVFGPGSTAQNHLKVPAFRFLGMLNAMVVVTSLSDLQF